MGLKFLLSIFLVSWVGFICRLVSLGQAFARWPALPHRRHSLLIAGQFWGMCHLPIAPQVWHCPTSPAELSVVELVDSSSMLSSSSSYGSSADAYLKARPERVERSLSCRCSRHGEVYLSMAAMVSSTTPLMYTILDQVFDNRAYLGSPGPRI